MTGLITLRALEPGEQPHRSTPDSDYDNFGPRKRLDPPPARVDEDGTVGIFEDDVVVGTVGWHWVHWGPNTASRCPMVGISLLPSARGRGIGAQAQRLVVDLLFRHTTVNRVEAHTDVTNIAEQHALEKAGFSREGIVRGGQWRDGEFHDGFLYSILRKEWEQR